MEAIVAADPSGTAAIIAIAIVIIMALTGDSENRGVLSSRSAPKSKDGPQVGER